MEDDDVVDAISVHVAGCTHCSRIIVFTFPPCTEAVVSTERGDIELCGKASEPTEDRICLPRVRVAAGIRARRSHDEIGGAIGVQVAGTADVRAHTVVDIETRREETIGSIECSELDRRRNMSGDTDERDRLKPAAARGRGFEPERFELGSDVMLSQFIAARARAATFEQIIGEKANVAAKGRVGDGLFGGADLGCVGLKGVLRPG